MVKVPLSSKVQVKALFWKLPDHLTAANTRLDGNIANIAIIETKNTESLNALRIRCTPRKISDFKTYPQ